MGGGGQTATTTQSIPDELTPLVSGSAESVLGLQGALPIGQFAQNFPKGVAGPSNLQTAAWENIPSLYETQPALGAAFGGYALAPEIASQPLSRPEAETAQQSLVEGLVGGQIGSSPATKAGMEAWRQSVLPQVQNQASLAGLGNSGPLLQAVGASGSQAFFPLIQQEIENRMRTAGQILPGMAQSETFRELEPRRETLNALLTGAQGLNQLGGTMFDQQLAALDAAQKAGGAQRDIVGEQNAAAFEDFLRLQNLSQSALSPVMSSFPSLLGSQTKQNKEIGLLTLLGK